MLPSASFSLASSLVRFGLVDSLVDSFRRLLVEDDAEEDEASEPSVFFSAFQLLPALEELLLAADFMLIDVERSEARNC